MTRSEHKVTAAEEANRTTTRNPKPEKEIHWVILREGKRVSGMDTMSRIVPSSSAARSRVKARQKRISSLLESQDPHVGYVCSTPQMFIMTDLRRTDTTESRGRLHVPRGRRASPLCRYSRYEVSHESIV